MRLALAGALAATAPFAVTGTANAASGSTWDRLAQCESSGNWNINTGNGFAGGLQFTPSTWRAFGGTGLAQNASREQQIAVAERVLTAQGWGAWPACSRKLGLR
ncbi:transglycosylase family protein [Pseudonocardia asaccharolytica]|nr:transglycosylase family protein [Pseudonocardia asaccharolytica]